MCLNDILIIWIKFILFKKYSGSPYKANQMLINRWINKDVVVVVIVQSLSHVRLFAIQWTVASQAPLSSNISKSLLKFISIGSVRLSSHFILFCFPLLLPSIFSSIRVSSNELTPHIRWPKYWSFSFSNNPSNKYSGLIFFRIDWSDLLTVHETLKSLL